MTILDHTPCFTATQATEFAESVYDVVVEKTTKLVSERDQNFLLLARNGQRFVLKISNATEDRQLLEAQIKMMQHLADRTGLCAVVVPTRSQQLLAEVTGDGASHLVRMVRFLEGRVLADVSYKSPALLRDLGESLGQIRLALDDFDHPALHRQFYWDLAQGESVIAERIDLLTDNELKKNVAYLVDQFSRYTRGYLEELPKGIIHNDANAENVVICDGTNAAISAESIRGLIDFGDAVHSWTINELAIGVAYSILDSQDPLATAAELIRGYHSRRPLMEPEIDALFGLICLRLCQSVAIAAEQHAARPDDEYLLISEKPIREMLPRLVDIPFRFASAFFRTVCGLPAIGNHDVICKWIQSDRDKFAFPVNPTRVGMRPEDKKLLVLDLSVASSLLGSDDRQLTEQSLTALIFDQMRAKNASVGVGRYLEPRLLYSSPQFGAEQDWADERRTIHLGIDLFAPAGCEVVAPVKATVFAVEQIDKPLDYGGVVVLKHLTEEGEKFFTLYGHLSPESFAHLNVGDDISKGQPFARLGSPNENGGWTPHLHFQIILDDLDLGHNFPGVVEASKCAVWSAFSPDPNLMLNLPESIFPATSPAKTETLTRRRTWIGRNLSVAYQNPLKIVRGWKQYLYDDAARKYIDAYNNVPHVGHCHPRIVEAVHSQNTLLNTNTRYLHDNIVNLAERIAATMPAGLEVCYFLNSASEANELALRLAGNFTGRRDVIVLEAAYHGQTTTLIDISPYKHDGRGGRGRPEWVHVAPIADVYRGPYRDTKLAGGQYAEKVGKIIERLSAGGRQPSCFIAESCPSVGGQIIFPDNYLNSVYEMVRATGAVCIADDVQTGYGRLGSHFYGFETQSVIPDIVVLGKPIGNGHPLAAVITTRGIADAFDNGMEFFSTFGGNPVSCAAGLAVLDVMVDENLQQNAAIVGDELLSGLKQLQGQFDIIGDVRGRGFFLGVELVRDQDTLEPATEEANFAVNRMRDRGVLIGTDGPFDNVLKIRPPMVFSMRDAEILLEMMERSLIEAASCRFPPFTKEG